MKLTERLFLFGTETLLGWTSWKSYSLMENLLTPQEQERLYSNFSSFEANYVPFVLGASSLALAAVAARLFYKEVLAGKNKRRDISNPESIERRQSSSLYR